MLKQAFENARLRAAAQALVVVRSDLATVGALRWHDMRHEAISRCFDAGWTSEQVMDFSGHVDIKSLLRYRHPRVHDGVARLREMEARRQAQLPPRGDLIGRVVISAAPPSRQGQDSPLVREARDVLRGLGGRIWHRQLTARHSVIQCTGLGLTVFEADPLSPAAQEYSRLCNSVANELLRATT